MSIVVGEFNRGGDPDLAVTNIAGDSVSVLLGFIGGTFSWPKLHDRPSLDSVAVGDFDGNGDPDLAVTWRRTSTSR